jgi:hypothetical protein
VACSAYGGEERRGVYRVLVGEPAEKNPLRRNRLRRKNIFKMDLQEVEGEGMYWIVLAHEREMWRALVNAVMNLRGT